MFGLVLGLIFFGKYGIVLVPVSIGFQNQAASRSHIMLYLKGLSRSRSRIKKISYDKVEKVLNSVEYC